MTMYWQKSAGLISLFLSLLYIQMAAVPSSGQNIQTAPELTEQQQRNWVRFWEEHQGHKLIMEYSAEYRPGTLAIVGVNVIPMTGEGVLERQTVIVEDGRIVAIGPDSDVRPPKGANIITAFDFYLIPGLTEAHSHTIFTQHQFLVYLTRGITTLREMDGWPWMLKAREMAANNDLLIPNLYVAGHILSFRPFDFFMTKVDSVNTARRLVQEQAAAGYDFIKIHNSMPVPLFDALIDEANKLGMDVIGHIPDEITIEKAIQSGMRTSEHFKGYLHDGTLQITNQDYVTDTKGADMWHSPTFNTYHDNLRGEKALELATRENSLRLVPKWLLASWKRNANQKLDPLTELRQTIYPKSREIFTNLRPVTDKFIAGTDTGTYAFMVPGYALQEEVRTFEDLGLSPFEALKTATVNSAEAFRKLDEFGTIEVGKRADFVILSKNPLEGTGNLAAIWGVSVRGTWLPRDALKRIEDSLEQAFSEDNIIPAVSRETLETLVSEMETLEKEGFPYPVYSLEEIEKLLEALGFNELAARVTALQRVQDKPIRIPG